MSPASPALAGGFFTTEPPGELLFTLVGDKFSKGGNSHGGLPWAVARQVGLCIHLPDS